MAPVALLVAIFLADVSAVDVQVPYQEGRRLYELGRDMDGALRALDRAVSLDPAHADSRLYRALVLEHERGLTAARPDFAEALRLAPGRADVWRHFADGLSRGGEPALAEAYYLVAIALDPRYGDAWYMLGRLYRKRGDLPRALRMYERDAALQPKGSARHEMGEVALALGDLDRAERELEADLAIDPTCYESRINLAGLLLARGDAAGARRHYEESLAYHPADARALSGLGRAYLALGDHERAVGTLRSAVELAPDDRRAADALSSARFRLRVAYGWPFAAIAAGALLLLGGHVLRVRRTR